MPEWIDLALMPDELSLSTALENLTHKDRDEMIRAISDRLKISEVEMKNSMLRLLVERVRPFALPTSLWSRAITDSDNPRTHVRRHFAAQRIAETNGRVENAVALYNQFATERIDRYPQLTNERLKEANHCCQHCGLRFYNEELVGRNWESPWGNRRKEKYDLLKPHWETAKGSKLRQPTIDHDWPISLFGDNGEKNLKILCKGCNEGKAKLIAFEQTRPYTGLPTRADLQNPGAVSVDVFYAQLRRSPRCKKTGKSSVETELTVRLINDTMAPLLDNLETVASPD
ncbi:5-methylcytosine-specific restriction endonuclease McrA [Rhizobium sp. BK181]|uniref:HNH endonuclease n=1 Tax=Rhizobium sp. BK181 TaxID=2587072 RepID=UPI00160B010E|nr:hypothetical protein [Rhizobium sp. BK181]MBB3319935.1 5-methylcytosine-specific restriction endonuclease McrA [Rhizobium sp. BK181]